MFTNWGNKKDPFTQICLGSLWQFQDFKNFQTYFDNNYIHPSWNGTIDHLVEVASPNDSGMLLNMDQTNVLNPMPYTSFSRDGCDKEPFLLSQPLLVIDFGWPLVYQLRFQNDDPSLSHQKKCSNQKNIVINISYIQLFFSRHLFRKATCCFSFPRSLDQMAGKCHKSKQGKTFLEGKKPA